jgi:hypothetical protein
MSLFAPHEDLAAKTAAALASGYAGVQQKVPNPNYRGGDDPLFVWAPPEWDPHGPEDPYYVCAVFNNGSHIPLPFFLGQPPDDAQGGILWDAALRGDPAYRQAAQAARMYERWYAFTSAARALASGGLIDAIGDDLLRTLDQVVGAIAARVAAQDPTAPARVAEE